MKSTEDRRQQHQGGRVEREAERKAREGIKKKSQPKKIRERERERGIDLGCEQTAWMEEEWLRGIRWKSDIDSRQRMRVNGE